MNVDKMVCICEIHKIKKSKKVFELLKKYNTEVYCEKCSSEIRYKRAPDLHIANNSKNILCEIFNKQKKFTADKIKLFYPNAFLCIENIKNAQPNNFKNRLNIFLYNPDLKCKKCNDGIVSFDHNNRAKEFCEKCNRVDATSELAIHINMEYWKHYLINNFNINVDIINISEKDIKISNLCKHYIDSIYTINKKKIKSLKSRGAYSICDDCNKEFYLKSDFIDMSYIIKDKWNFIKTLSEDSLLSYDPYIWAYIARHMIKYDASFTESKFMIKYDIHERPKCNVCKNSASFNLFSYDYSAHCNDHLYTYSESAGEIDIRKYLAELDIDYKEKCRGIIGKKELDIYIPSHNLAIEFNGLYWHSDKKKDKNYHHSKWLECKKNNIFLITIWEDDWNYKKEIIKSIIKNKVLKNTIKIYARETVLKIIDNKDKQKFLYDNHLQGDISAYLNLGLFYKNELVSLMNFGKKRMITNSLSNNIYDYELLRFCNKTGISVIGAASKLFSFFIKNYKFNQIISYSNLDISDGGIYNKLGFKYGGFAGINYWWSKNGRKYHRSNFMKHKLVKKGYDKNKSESEIMINEKYNKIWGTGNDKWIYELDI